MTGKKRMKPWLSFGFKVRYRGNGVQVDEGQTNGRRTRKNFKTAKEAEDYCRDRRAELTNKGIDASGLSDRDRLEAAEARKELGEASILEACRFYLRHHATGSAGMTVAGLVEEYLKAPGRRGGKLIERRPATVKAARMRLSPFKAALGDRPVSDIARSDVDGWLEAGGWSGLNRKHYLANARALYGYALRKGYVAINPAEGIELPENPEATIPEIMTPAQVKAVLMAAVSAAPGMVPRLAVSFFCGLRPTELTRLDWSAVNLAGGFITVSPEAAKMRRQRHVEMPVNLVQWLTPYRKVSGPLWPWNETTYWHKLARVLKLAKLKALPYNAGRHAFASYHLARHSDPGKTSLLLGHTKPDLLFNVYRGIHTSDGAPVSKATAEAFFKIRPEGKTNVIQIPVAAAG